MFGVLCPLPGVIILKARLKTSTSQRVAAEMAGIVWILSFDEVLRKLKQCFLT